jgi:hypothetical protein
MYEDLQGIIARGIVVLRRRFAVTGRYAVGSLYRYSEEENRIKKGVEERDNGESFSKKDIDSGVVGGNGDRNDNVGAGWLYSPFKGR